jgi:hypothetical protein
MIRISRKLLSVLAIMYALLHAALGSFWVTQYDDSLPAIAAIVVYLAVVIPSIVLYRGDKLPVAHAIAGVALGLMVPLLAQSRLASNHFNDYSTWYVLGLATLFAVIAIRGYVGLALVGAVLEAITVAGWAGWQNFLATGLLGALTVVGGAAVVTIGLNRAADEARRYADLNTVAVAEAAALQAAGEQRARLLRATLDKARPMLRRIAQPRELNPEERIEARLLEASLRDEIRGKDLIGEATRTAIDRARRRGISVTVLDEGGVAGLNPAQLERLHARLAAELEALESGRVTIRAPRDEEWLLTIAAFTEDSNVPSVWLRLGENDI